MAKEIPLTQGKVAIVDDEDYEYLSQWKWCCRSGRYAGRVSNKKTVLMHRFIINAPIDMDVDHINGNGLDNRRSNLRLCYHSQNACNRRLQKNNTSGYKGVSFCERTRKWSVKICCNHKQQKVGYFGTPEEAAKAYDQKALELHGDFARLNFPNEA